MNTDIFDEMNDSPIEKRLEALHWLFEKAVYFREDAWFHYEDGKDYEIRDSEMLRTCGSLLKRMSKNGGKL